MGKALQVVTGQVTNPSTTITALSANSGDSFTVQNAAQGSDIRLLNMWAFSATAGLLRVRSPKMHDQTQNIRAQYTASEPYPLLGAEEYQALYAQDPITVEMTGDALAVDLASLLISYDNLPGIDANLQAWSAVMPLIKELTTVEVDLTSSGTAGDYSAQVALNADFDTLKRNEYYAIIGYSCGTTGGTLGFTGNFSGNLRVGGPLINDPQWTANWFVRLNQASGKPTIPVFNAADVAAIFLDCACQATSTSFKVGVNLAHLTQALT